MAWSIVRPETEFVSVKWRSMRGHITLCQVLRAVLRQPLHHFTSSVLFWTRFPHWKKLQICFWELVVRVLIHGDVDVEYVTPIAPGVMATCTLFLGSWLHVPCFWGHGYMYLVSGVMATCTLFLGSWLHVPCFWGHGYMYLVSGVMATCTLFLGSWLHVPCSWGHGYMYLVSGVMATCTLFLVVMATCTLFLGSLLHVPCFWLSWLHVPCSWLSWLHVPCSWGHCYMYLVSGVMATCTLGHGYYINQVILYYVIRALENGCLAGSVIFEEWYSMCSNPGDLDVLITVSLIIHVS